MMNNYTIDVSIFLLNEDEFLEADEKRKETLVKKVCRAIEKYTVLRDSLDSSVFFSRFAPNEVVQKLKNNAFRKYNEEIEQLLGDGGYSYRDSRKALQGIIDAYQSEDEYHQENWRQDFNNQFDIGGIGLDSIWLSRGPENKILETYGENFRKTIASIALLNQYVYRPDYDKHLFLYKGLAEFGGELEITSSLKDISIENDELKEIIKKPGKLEGVVKKKSLKSIITAPKKFETLEKAVEQAQKEFADNLIFGNDIERGVKERNKDAGPPDRVYYYLKTLSEITGIKRTVHPNFSLALLARMYGCNCADGSSKEMLYDGGGGESGFADHLRPAESKSPYYIDKFDDGNCIRIFFKWSEETKKTIVGWIGKHPCYGTCW
jgi:hypothetical protein